METADAIFGVAFVAFCVWIGVRIVNRLERWAKWTAIGIAVMLVYPLSYAPSSWLLGKGFLSWGQFKFAYRPILELADMGLMRDAIWGRGDWSDDSAVLDNLIRDSRTEHPEIWRSNSAPDRVRPFPFRTSVNPPAPNPDAPSELN